MIEYKIPYIRAALSKTHLQFNSYSAKSQEKIASEVFRRSQNLSMSQVDSLIGSVTLSEPGTHVCSSMNHPMGEAFVSLLLTESDWHVKVPTFQTILSFLPSILWKKDPGLFKEARNWLQSKIESAEAEVPNEKMRSIYVRNLISYFPYLDLKQGEQIRLPLGHEGSDVTYTVEAIELTPDYLGSPITAYGLIPEEGPEAPPILLFKGTTYPADEGFYLSLLTDINPHGPVGGLAFQIGKEKIKTWLKDHTGESKAEVMGTSLGGCLSLQTVSECSEYIKAAYAFNTPGVTSDEVASWNQSESKPDVHVFLQDGDIISSFIGRCFAPDWKIYSVFAPSSSHFQAHAATYTAHPEAFIIPERAEDVNHDMKRRFWPTIQNLFLLPAFLIGTLFLLVITVCICASKIFKKKDPLKSKTYRV